MSVAARLERLDRIDVSSMSMGAVTGALRDISVIRGKTDQIEAALTRRLTELHESGQAIPAVDVLGRQGRSSRRTAEKVERRSETLGEAPRLNDALGQGKVGAEHADALAGVAGRLGDDHRAELFARDAEITELAASFSPETFRRKLHTIVDEITDDDRLDRAARQADDATVSMRIDAETGMHTLYARLTPEAGNKIRRALDHEAAALAKLDQHRGLRRDQVLARALEAVVCGEAVATGMGPAEVAVLIDDRTLTQGRHGGTICEYSDGSPIPAETARRHACEAKIVPVVLGGESEVLDVGRARRLATSAQRSALRAVYRTCAIDGCDAHFDRCHVHHLHEWEEGGATDLANLLPLCSFHHHRVHEGRWRLCLDPRTRHLTVRLPDGTLHSRSSPDRHPARGAA